MPAKNIKTRLTTEKTTVEVSQMPPKKARVVAAECFHDFDEAEVRWNERFVIAHGELSRGLGRPPLIAELLMERNPPSDGYRVSLQVTSPNRRETRTAVRHINTTLTQSGKHTGA